MKEPIEDDVMGMIYEIADMDLTKDGQLNNLIKAAQAIVEREDFQEDE